ncbi:MAG: alpha/beta hydrolase [Candidatus Tectomicrobia bacterium]|nr:alpha/beta hydrolase [Candidatus Tectomicrobia bacterium]
MAKAVRKAGWFAYFPEDYRWSAAISMAYSSSYWGAAVMGEIDQVGRRLAGRAGDDAAWFREWVRMGDRMRTLGVAAERERRGLTAAAFFKRACTYYLIGERFRTPKDQKALDAYRKALDCFMRFARLTDRPRIERVEIPFGKGKSLPGLFVHAENTRRAKPPAVVFFDGLDVTKELQYMLGTEDLVRRGISALLVDAPGNGEAIRFRKLYLRHDHEVAGAAALDYLETRKDVNARRVGVMGISLGGYYAPRNASMEKRFKACVGWGAEPDYHERRRKRIAAAFKTALSVPSHHIQWILNAKSLEEVLRKLEPFRLDGVVQKMRCPYLLVHGEDDQQVPLESARALFRMVGSKDKTLKVFTAAEGGAQHCQMDNVPLAAAFIHDWLKEKQRA